MSRYILTIERKFDLWDKIKRFLFRRQPAMPSYVAVGDMIESVDGTKFRITEVQLDFQSQDFYSYTAKLEEVEKNEG